MLTSAKKSELKMHTIVNILNKKPLQLQVGDRVAISCHYQGRAGFMEFVKVSDSIFISATTTTLVTPAKMETQELLAMTAFIKLFKIGESDIQISHAISITAQHKTIVNSTCPVVVKKMVVLPYLGHDGYTVDY